MEPLPVDVAQLQRRDPMAWSTLLSRAADLNDVIVTAVTSEPLWTSYLAPTGRTTRTWSRQVTRYLLTIDGCSDPLSFVGKRTNTIEAQVYHNLGPELPELFAPCHFIHMDGDRSWLLLEEAPNHFPPSSWVPKDIDAVVTGLAKVHATFWDEANESDLLDWLPFYFDESETTPTPDELKRESPTLFEEGPGALISDHALQSAGGLAPLFVQAANGLVIMRELGGWPGVLGETHLAALADLIDDPLPMLNTLRDLPVSVLHTAPHTYNWSLTLFDHTFLLDWSEARLGPGVLDLVSFLETYPLLYVEEDLPRTLWPSSTDRGDRDEIHVRVRDLTPALEETVVDGYLLAMSSALGSTFPARQMRQALPAARCLYVLTNWLPYFATWASDMPNRYVWQRVNRMTEAELAENGLGPMVGIRPYFAGVFQRFLQAYRNL
ncbi:MAG: hypothetical protein R3C44_18935 [Chloroflexota bacterium]